MKAFCITDVGQNRSMNQDFVFASETPVGNLPNLFVVADGMEATEPVTPRREIR